MPITNPLMFKLIACKVTATYGRIPCSSSSGGQFLHHFALVLNDFRNATKFHCRILFLWTFSTLVATANNNTQNHGNRNPYKIDLSQFKSINTIAWNSSDCFESFSPLLRRFVIGILFLAKPPNSGTSLMLTGFQHYISATQRDCSGLILNSMLTELNDGRDDKQ